MIQILLKANLFGKNFINEQRRWVRDFQFCRCRSRSVFSCCEIEHGGCKWCSLLREMLCFCPCLSGIGPEMSANSRGRGSRMVDDPRRVGRGKYRVSWHRKCSSSGEFEKLSVNCQNWKLHPSNTKLLGNFANFYVYFFILMFTFLLLFVGLLFIYIYTFECDYWMIICIIINEVFA